MDHRADGTGTGKAQLAGTSTRAGTRDESGAGTSGPVGSHGPTQSLTGRLRAWQVAESVRHVNILLTTREGLVTLLTMLLSLMVVLAPASVPLFVAALVRRWS
jgi:hypothetical protein